MIDKKKIRKICIDDFAIKKRASYGTIMIDIETHRVIDLIPSRDFEDVVKSRKTVSKYLDENVSAINENYNTWILEKISNL